MAPNDYLGEKNLLEQLSKGSHSAFESIYRDYYGILYLHALRKTGDRDVAKDIIHDLFAYLWQHRDRLHIHTKLSSYLYTGVKNRVLDWVAKGQSESRYLSSLGEYLTSSKDAADERLQEKMIEDQIEETLKSLPPRVREIFELSRKQYLTHKEIAHRLQLSEHTVRSYIKEALRTLRYRLGALLWVLFVFFVKIF